MRYKAPLIVTLLLVAAGAGAIWYNHYLGPSSEMVARELVGAFAEFDDPERAAAEHADVCGKRFANGEWIFGVGLDGHSWKRARDTLVLKDSRGEVRVLGGHVCGPRWLEHYLEHFHSLDQFNKQIAVQFVKMNLPPQ